jgi:hypothetical protein
MLRRGVVEDVKWMEAHGDLPAVSSLVRGLAIADHRSPITDAEAADPTQKAKLALRLWMAKLGKYITFI